MSKRATPLTDDLYDYLVAVSVREPEALRRVREETDRMPDSQMQISPDQGQFMALLVELMGATSAIEVGTFTGYSTLSVARALPAQGQLVACELSQEYAELALANAVAAGVGDKISFRMGPAADSLRELIEEGQSGSFDFAFIDADKEGYDGYYEACLQLVRVGGLIAIDNVLWGGSVTDPDNPSSSTQAIRALNTKIYSDDRVSISLVGVGDGLMLARRRV